MSPHNCTHLIKVVLDYLCIAIETYFLKLAINLACVTHIEV